MLCLPKELADKFVNAIRSGQIDPPSLADMSSEERRAAFSKIVGEDNARGVNALFEQGLLKKNQEVAMVKWAKEVAGITEPRRADLLAKIQGMTEILSPTDRKSYMEDLVAKKLGVAPSFEETKKVVELSNEAQKLRDALASDPYNKSKQIEYGRAFMNLRDYVDSTKPKPKLWTATNIINLPKSALTSILHFSAPFVQGRGLFATRPYWEAFGNQFKYYASEESFKDLEASIIGHPNYPIARTAGLGLTKLGDKLSTREEAIQSSILEHIPGLNIPVKSSSRAFTGFLNEIRFKNFNNLLEAARLRGEDVSKGSKAAKQIADTVNNFSGRGSLGAVSPEWQPKLNNFFFSPRKIVATMQMFNPAKYLDPKTSYTAKLGAMKYLVGTVMTQAAILEMAHLAGAQVGMNPTSSDFLKIRIGKTTIDTTGGSAIYLRLLGRISEGKYTSQSGHVSSLTGGTYGGQTRLDQVVTYLRDKLSPTASMIADFLQGTDPVGKPFNLYGEGKGGDLYSSEIYNKFTPIVMQQFIDLAQSHQNAAMWLPSISAIFGVDVQTPTK